MLEIPTLETERLRLRAYTTADFPAYAAMWQEPAVYRFIGGEPIPRERAWTMFLRQIGLWHHLGFGFWALELKANGVFAGECGFQERLRDIEPSIEGTLEAGWALAPPMQGQGLASEAMRAAMDWAAMHATRDLVTAIIDADNRASRRVADKLGFALRGPAIYNGTSVRIFARSRRT
jgi:RimJ/RimL family protein N-acetyltransferase